MSRESRFAVLGVVTIVIGILLVLGGSSFLLVSLLSKVLPRFVILFPVVQILLGLTASVAGEFARRGSKWALYVIGLVAIGVLSNVGLLIILVILLKR